jgi:phage N-6-adenine-methyltransferase
MDCSRQPGGHVSLVNHRAKNHPQQVAKNGAVADVDDRRTPPALYDPLHAEFGFTLDVAASDENTKCSRYYTAEHSAFEHAWCAENVWCNPPYSDIGPWVRKAWIEIFKPLPPALIAMLVPANRTEQGWWQEHVEPWRDREPRDGVRLTTRFLRGRQRFDRPGWTKPQKGDRPPFGLVLLIWSSAAPVGAR